MAAGTQLQMKTVLTRRRAWAGDSTVDFSQLPKYDGPSDEGPPADSPHRDAWESAFRALLLVPLVILIGAAAVFVVMRLMRMPVFI